MNKELAEKITLSELEVMKLLWHAEDALPVTEIREQLQRTKGWEPATIKTLVGRLVAKGAISQEKRKVFYYAPLISEKDYNTWATVDLIQRLYNGSAREMVAALVHADGLSREDLEELRAMFHVEE